MDLRELDQQQFRKAQAAQNGAAEYRLEISLSVQCARQLWSCAFNKALTQSALTHADIMELIGSRDDPSVDACLAMIAEPAIIPGCTLDDFKILPTQGLAAH